jgi:PAS domain S-box-containing protein
MLAAELLKRWDAVVVDQSGPGFSAEAVIERLEAAGLRLPVVVVCDPTGEDSGPVLVERGAADWLAADRLARLPLAVRAAVDRDDLSLRLVRTQALAEGFETMLRAAFESSPTAVIAVDDAARVVEWNASAERLLGWSSEEARCQRLVDLVGDGRTGGQSLVAIAQAAGENAGRRQIAPVMLRRRDGQPVHFDVWASRRTGQPAGTVLALTDITEHWRSEWLKDHQLGVLRALASSGEEAALLGALEQMSLSVRGIEARLWEIDPRGTLQLRAGWRPADAGPASEPPLADPPAFLERTVSTGGLSFSEAGSGGELGERIGIPLASGRQVLGAVEVHAPGFAGFDDAYVAHLTSLGAYVGNYLAQRRSEADLARSLEALNRINGDRRRLTRLLVQAHEDERRSIAADIHDDPIQVMAAATLRLHSLRRRIGDERAQHTVDAVEEMVGAAVTWLRRLMFNLRPPGLDRGDLIGPLHDRLEQVRQDQLIDYSLTGSAPPNLTTEVRVTLYRVAQEAIANVIKHASASRIDVLVAEHEGGCLIRIADNGSGLVPGLEGRAGHLGLPSMRERTELAGGWLRVEPGQPSGTVVSAWVPLHSSGASARGPAP